MMKNLKLKMLDKLKINRGKLVSDGAVSFVMTENCNFLCKHCLRGEKRNVVISKEVIDKVLSQVNINGTLHLSGGEPLLAIKEIVYLLSKLEEYGSNPERISIITNGSIGSDRFRQFVNAAFKIEGLVLKIMVSNDYYHVQERLRLNDNQDNIIDNLRSYVKVLREYGYSIPEDNYFDMLENYEGFTNGHGVSAIGKGKNILGAEVIEREFKLRKHARIKRGFVRGDFQVQPDGRITIFKDLSWEERDQHYDQQYSIHEHPLQRILTSRHL